METLGDLDLETGNRASLLDMSKRLLKKIAGMRKSATCSEYGLRQHGLGSENNPPQVGAPLTIAGAMNNPRKDEVVDWPYATLPHPGVMMYQNPDVFLQGGARLSASSSTDKAPYMTEALNKHRADFFELATGYLLSSGIAGDYHEYGCFSGTTFRMALTNASLFNLLDADPEMLFHAFDSFEGLPEVSPDLAEGSNWTKGSMAMSETEFLAVIRKHNVFPDKVRTYPGFYSDSLTSELQRDILSTGRRASFLNIDCDLYESANDVLNFVGPFIQQGTLIYFYDWYCGYRGSNKAGIPRAFSEFLARKPIEVVPFRDCGWWGKSFIVASM